METEEKVSGDFTQKTVFNEPSISMPKESQLAERGIALKVGVYELVSIITVAGMTATQ